MDRQTEIKARLWELQQLANQLNEQYQAALKPFNEEYVRLQAELVKISKPMEDK
jgi:hypothetical protein